MRLTLLILGGLLIISSVVMVFLNVGQMLEVNPDRGLFAAIGMALDSQLLKFVCGLTAIAVSNLLADKAR